MGLGCVDIRVDIDSYASISAYSYKFLEPEGGIEVSISTRISTVSRQYHRYRQVFRECIGSFTSISKGYTSYNP